jgi:hypothetical protein
MRLRLVFGLLILLGVFCAPSRAQQEPVDLLLVLTADISRSVDVEKFKLQREGYAAAFSDPRVIAAATSGPNGRIAVMFVEWAGFSQQKVVIDWTVIDGAEASRGFAAQLIEAPRPFIGSTSISGGIIFAMAQMARAPYKPERRTIDVSGDGTHNSGRDVKTARDEAVAQGITVNGLVILSAVPSERVPEHTHPPGGLANYYKENVIGGDGAFVITAENFQSFGRAIINKLIAEIAVKPKSPGKLAAKIPR